MATCMHEAEDDCLLMDNAAAASLLSPTIWLGGTRPRVQRRVPNSGEADRRQQGGQGSPELEGVDMDADTDMETMEQLREDMQRLAALEDMYTKLKLQNAVLERQLMGIYTTVNRVLEENRCMKRLVSLLQVRRADFVAEEPQAAGPEQQGQQGQVDQPGQEAAAGHDARQPRDQQQQQEQHAMHLDGQFLEAVGRRLIGNLHQPGAAERRGMQQQQAAVVTAAAEGATVPSTPKVKPASAPRVVDSPRIPAHRGGQQHVAYLSPEDLPEEAQIAAAVLATTEGDASAALATLLDHAMAARQGWQ